MFVARLLAALKTPATHLGGLDDTLVLDVDLYRGALLHLVQKLGDEGAIDPATSAWTLSCIADGWVDEHLGNVRDGLLELGAVRDPAHLHRLLIAATHDILGCGPGTPAHGLVAVTADAGAEPPLSAADLLLLQAVTQALQEAESDRDPLGLRLLVRRYALELGLLTRGEPQGVTGTRRTPIGDALLALPASHVLAFLLALEMLQSGGPADRWRTPRSALVQMQAQAQFLVATTASARRCVDPAGLFPWRRIRRLHLLGVCEPVRLPAAPGAAAADDPGRDAYPFRLSAVGAAAIAWVLAEPRTELLELAERLLSARAQAAVEPLLRHLPATAPALSSGRPPMLAQALPLRLLGPGLAAGLSAEPPAAPEVSFSAAAAAYPLAIAASASAPPSSGEVAWQVAGPLATLPAAAAALTGSLLSDALLASMGELCAIPGKPPGSGPAADGGSRQELDIGGLIQRAWAELHIAGVHFTLLGPSVSAVGERRALLQAWRELLRSAADAALQGSHCPPLITVELDPEPDAVQILVHDSGPPLSAEDAATLAQTCVELLPLSREPGPVLGFADLADGGTRLVLDGMRRGLWLARRTLSEQGAQLALSTPQLGGTTVRITLPRSPRPLRSAA